MTFRNLFFEIKKNKYLRLPNPQPSLASKFKKPSKLNYPHGPNLYPYLYPYPTLVFVLSNLSVVISSSGSFTPLYAHFLLSAFTSSIPNLTVIVSHFLELHPDTAGATFGFPASATLQQLWTASELQHHLSQ